MFESLLQGKAYSYKYYKAEGCRDGFLEDGVKGLEKSLFRKELCQRYCLTLPVPSPGPHLASDEEGGGGGVTPGKNVGPSDSGW